MKVTIKDIAQECGVSPSAVSLVLNNRESRISTDTKQRILDTAKKHHYRPNHLASGRTKKILKTIGIIVPDIGNLFFAELCKGCENEARKHNYTLMIASTDEFSGNSIRYINTFLDNQIDGLICVPPSSLDAESMDTLCSRILETGTPFVTVDRPVALDGVTSITIDNVAGGYTATKHLLSLGHRKIGALTGPMKGRTSQERLEGYKKALDEFHVPFDNSLIMEGDFTVDSGYRSLAYMRGQSATALFCFNDMMAMGAYRAARDYRVSIPRDISVVGYDDIFIADMLETPLTTINQPAYDLGICSVSTLLNIIYHKHSENSVFVPTLKLRSSTCPPCSVPQAY